MTKEMKIYTIVIIILSLFNVFMYSYVEALKQKSSIIATTERT